MARSIDRAGRTSLVPASLVAAVALALLVVTPAVGSSYTITPGGAPVRVVTTQVYEKATATFRGTTGQRVSLRMTNVAIGTSGCCSTRVSIVKPDGTNLVAPTAVGTSGGFVDVRTLPATGTYKIVVDPQLRNTGAMTLTLFTVPVDPSPAITAGGAPVSVSTTMPGQNAQPSFTGAAGERVSLRLTSVAFGASTCCSAKVSILAPDGSSLFAPVSVGTAGVYIDTKTLPANGTYRILMNPLSTATGSATLTLYGVPADATASLTSGVAAGVASTVPGQNLAPTFAGTAGRRLSVALSNAAFGTAAKVTILNPDGTALTTPLSVGSLGAFVEPVTLPTTGAYRILVDPPGPATGSITVTAYDVPADASGSLVAGTPLTLSTTTPGQNAFATFSETAGGRISVNVGNVAIGSSSAQAAKLSVLKPDGTTLVGPMSFGSFGLFVDTQSLPVGGTYKVVVDPQSTYAGSADVTLYSVPADVAGAVATNGTPVTPTLSAGQNARYSFTGTTGQRVSLSLSNVTIGTAASGLRVAILKPDGTALFSPAQSLGTNGAFVEPKTLPAAGTYKVLVDPQGANAGSATLAVYNVPADPAPSATYGTPVGVSLTAPGQNARVAFAGTAGQRVALKLSGVTIGTRSDCCTSVYLLRPDGTKLNFFPWIAGTSGTFADPSTLPATGTYQVLVDPRGTDTGNATVTVYNVPADMTGTIANPGSATATAGTPGQTARLTFIGTAGQSRTLTASSVTVTPASSLTSVYVYAGTVTTGSPLAILVFDSAGGSTSFSLPSSGTYTIVFDPTAEATGSASLALS